MKVSLEFFFGILLCHHVEYNFFFCIVILDPDINIADLDIPVNAVATALKDFFLKRLPPIFPSDSMANIANLAKQYTDIGQLSEMRTFLRELPNSNFEILKHMISHFVK